MSEIDQLKERIVNSKLEGIKTADICKDYEPAGDLMIHQLTESNEFVSRRITSPSDFMSSEWRIFKPEFKPY